MNINIYNQIRSTGLNMTSPAVGVGNAALAEVNAADAALQPLEDLGVVDTDILQQARSSLGQANSSLTGGVSQIATTANDSLRLSGMAQQVNRVDALVGQVPSSCFNTEAMFASVNGACDELFNAVGDVAKQISDKVAAYLAGSVDLSELESFLSGVGSALQGSLDGLADKFASETALLQELKDKIEASSLAQSIEALWNNPCTQAVLDTTLPPDIKAHL